MKTPSDERLEAAFLDCLMMRADGEAGRIVAQCDAGIFSHPLHAKIYEGIKRATADGLEPDAVVVASWCPEALALRVEDPINSYELKGAFATLSDIRARRDAYHGALKLIEAATSENARAAEVGAMADALAREISDRMAGTRKIATTYEQVNQALKEAQDAWEGKTIPRIRTGLTWYDDMVVHYRSQIHCIAARSGVGKTTMAVQLAMNQVATGNKVAYFILESEAVELVKRLLATMTGIPVGWVLGGIKSPDKRQEFTRRARDLSAMEGRLWIRGPREWDGTIEDMSSQVAKLSRDHVGIDAVYLDYLQNLKPPRSVKCKSKEEQIGANMALFHESCMANEYAGVVLSQLSRAHAHDKRKPDMHDLRGSGDIEHYCHIVSFIHRTNEPADWRENQQCEWYSAKTRLIAPWTMPLEMDGGKGIFYPVEG
jgi:replicative DNA helicase